VESLQRRIHALEALIELPPTDILKQWVDHDGHVLALSGGDADIAVPGDISAALMHRTNVEGSGKKRRRTSCDDIQDTDWQSSSTPQSPSNPVCVLQESKLEREDSNEVRRLSEIIATPSPAASSEDASFFGLTSPPHVWSRMEQLSLNSTNEPEQSPYEPDLPAIAVDMNSTQLRTHLLHTFFKYETLWLTVVNKAVFMAHRQKGVQSQWYSQFLESVLLASAARLSTSSAVRALGNKYAKEARADMIQALAYPSPASLQGFLMLSEFEATEGNERSGWMLCGK
jgi:hypothetical protein